MPCGVNSRCEVFGGVGRCVCVDGYSGFPPFCKKKCTCETCCKDEEHCVDGLCQPVCSWNMCRAPNTECVAKEHKATCSCKQGFIGDATVGCTLLSEKATTSEGRLG